MTDVPFYLREAGRPTKGSPRCCDCGRTGAEAYDEDEVAGAISDDVIDADGYARSDGTYNPETNRFCCNGCYVARGCPSLPPRRGGWRAP